MKNIPTLYTAIALFLLTALSSCGERAITPANEFTPFISAHTGGVINQSSTIRIELVNEQPGIEPNTEITDRLFSFSPNVRGRAFWVNSRTIEFIPDENQLRQGQTYQAVFRLGNILKVDKRFRDFHFDFHVAEKSFAMQVNPLRIVNSESATVTGDIRFSDETTLELVKRAFSVRISDNQPLAYAIEEGEDSRTFRFSMDVERQNTDLDLDIAVEGRPFGIDRTLGERVTIPDNIFRVLSVGLITQPETGIQIVFSDPVSTTQDLRGLITITELPNITFQVRENMVNIFFARGELTQLTLVVNDGVRNTQGERLTEGFTRSVTIEQLPPQVQILRSGNIIPTSENVLLPFRAVNLRAVDVRIIQIFESNVLMFLQDNNLAGSNQLRRSGRLVYRTTFRLDTDPMIDLHTWQDFSIDLSNKIRQEPGAIFRIELSFRREYSVFPCDGSERTDLASNTISLLSNEITEAEHAVWDAPNAFFHDGWLMEGFSWRDYVWEERNNPCHASFFMLSSNVRTSVNVMVSNIGVIAKANSENTLWISVADILTTRPISGANVTVYNFQLQPIGTARTDSDGFAVISPNGRPFVLVAESGGQRSHLRLIDGEANSLSRFDVGGRQVQRGLKGFIYGERGVWRPGDTLFITFVLHDPENRIPATHPVTLEMFNPLGQFYTRQVLTNSVNGFYVFRVPTDANDPTGLWNAYVKVGGATFHRSFRIETVRPNRLRINLDFGRDILNADQNIPVVLNSSWLTGATASNLRTEVEMTLTRTQTQFRGFERFIFNNPATDFHTSSSNVFSGTLNSEGDARFNFRTPRAETAPGMLNATIVARVFEQGGDASIFSQVIPFSPFSSYVGIDLNVEQGQSIETDTEHTFNIVTLNAQGQPVNRNNIEYQIYRVSWSWWWERGRESFANYVNSPSFTPVAQGRLRTVNGRASFNFRLNYPDWGRYLVFVRDNESGHATGGTVFIDWPSWRGRANRTDPSNINMLTFTTDKQSYEVGENITVTIPASGGGTALVSLENGSTVLSRTWVQLNENGDTKHTFRATEEMAPNFYIHISLLQPHAQTVNDLPIRMYGVIPVFISNKASVLEPQIRMPDVLRPETEFTINVSERTGRPMTYTIAIVDDGLLDLTNFRTPNPWNEFFAREALGIRTWDMYNFVMGAFGGRFSNMFSVGGDEALNQGGTRANRFRPVVKFLGPFELQAGRTNAHRVTLPMYVGSVRTMVVAGQRGAYGNAEKTTPVRAPLMILSSLPRVLSTDEEIMLPVNVFAMENDVRNVTVRVETAGLLEATNGNRQSVTFSQTGDQIVFFPMRTTSRTGVERITITATGGGHTATETIEINVRNPNPAIIRSDNKLVDAGETANFSYQLTGTSADEWVRMEVSRIPSVDITRRLDFLRNYQHMCSEQLISQALPLLFLSQFKDIDQQESERIRRNVQETIRTLYGRQLHNGGIVSWPGQSSAHDWTTSYAGVFFALAREKGYEVNDGVMNRWRNFQRRETQNWRRSTANNFHSRQSEFLQAFRLYSLALAGSAELGAMNRMKEMSNLSTQARWQLAAAYAVDGRRNIAQELIFNVPTTVENYSGGLTFGSRDRDEAMILKTMILIGDMQNAFLQAQRVSQNLSRENRFSTQSTAFAMMAMGMLAEQTSGRIEYSWTLNGRRQNDVSSARTIFQTDLPRNASGNISFTNTGTGMLYVNVVSRSQPIRDTLPEIANNLRINVAYTDLNGNPIDVQTLRQGTDFIAEVRVTNISPMNDFTDLALTHIIPSGWEIFNERMIGDENTAGTRTAFTYQDIRDDRVLTYFDLRRNQSITVRVRLNASYVGSFVLPAIQVEAMYDTSAYGKTRAGRVRVVR